MKEFNCIICPRGCLLHIEETQNGFDVHGNTCKRGYDFAISELTEPRRTICSCVKTSFDETPVLPVRVSEAIPKDKIFDVMKEIRKVTITKRIGRGEIVIANVLGLGVDVISTSNALIEQSKGFAREKQ